MRKSVLFIILTIVGMSIKANIRLPNILSNNMVLQQQSTTKVWGWAMPGEKIKITTSWDNKTIGISANGNATWQVNIQTPTAGGPYKIILEGENKIILENIFIGEVWLCGGQSNMEWSYNSGLSSIKDEFSQLSKLNIKLFKMPKTTSKTPQDNSEGSWVACDSNTLKAFSAVGYYFGKEVNKNLNVPIGLISSNWGGTPAEVWTSEALVENNPVLKEAAAKKKPTSWWPIASGYAYNAMIAPIVNYNIAGAIWIKAKVIPELHQAIPN